MVEFMEELSLNAWPALQTICYDGWLLRFANGYTSRANSVNPLYVSSLPILAKIQYCEQLYAARGQNTIFKLSPSNTSLDPILAELGYTYHNLTHVQTLELTHTEKFPTETTLSDVQISLTSSLAEAWLETFCEINNVLVQYQSTLTQMLSLLVPSHCFALLYKEGRPVATGLAVLERRQVGLFEIATDSTYRKQGLARELVIHLLAWGQQQGATNAYLQVVADNTAAVELYHKLGFVTSYDYWYRVKPLS
jgi:GNAT superfamily N-acetyltransferase